MLRRLTSARVLHTLLIAAALVVSLTPAHAQQYAKVLVQTGNVSFIKDASGYNFALMDNTQLMPGYKIKTGSDGYAKVQVPDGSTFEVFPNSEVVYTKTESITDLLNVWLGRVKIMIQHLPGVPNPNTVTTPTALISVRGTIFDVEVEDIDGTTLVSLDDGVVDVRNLRQRGKTVTLVPGQAIRVFRDQPLVGVGDHNFLNNLYKVVKRGYEDWIYTRPGGVGGNGGNVPIGNGKQGDKGQTTGTGTGTGTAPAPGTGSAPAPPPPPPGGGGGGD
jgi:hypothetical protein